MTTEDKKALEQASQTGVLVTSADRNDLVYEYLAKCHEARRPFVAALVEGQYAEITLLMRPAGRLLDPAAAELVRRVLWLRSVEGAQIKGGTDWACSSQVPAADALAVGYILLAAANYMTTAELVKLLEERGIRLTVEGNGLRVDGPVDPDLLVTLSLHQDNLTALINEHGPICPE